MIKNYIKIALKVLLRRKFFTFISLFGISFTLLVLMVATAMLENIFGPMPPEVKKDTTLGVYRISMRGGDGTFMGPPGWVFLDKYVRTLPRIKRASFFSFPTSVATYHEGRKIEAFMKRTDGEFWEILEFEFLEGGPFTRADEKNANFVCVINEATKYKFFENLPAVGKYITIDGNKFRISGVVKNVPIIRLTPFSDIWVPLSTNPDKSYLTEFEGFFWGLIEANNKKDFDEIKAEYQYRLKNLELPGQYKGSELTGAIETFFESFSRLFSPGEKVSSPKYLMGILLLLAVIFMLLPTINLININVSRIMERASEIGVRKAFGAASSTLIYQFIVENVIITIIGGIIGFILTYLVLQLINDSGIIKYAELRMNLNFFAYGLGFTLFFGIFSGVLPAWRMSRMHPVEALRGENL